MSTVTCINNALDVIRDAKWMEADQQAYIVDSLESILRRASADEATAIARMKAAARDARLDMEAAQYSRLVQDSVDPQVRARYDATNDPTALDRVTTDIVPRIGGRANKESGSWLDQVRAETNQLLGSLSNVIKYVGNPGLLLRASDGDAALARELVGLDSRDPVAKAMAKQVREALDPWIDRALEAGYYIHRREFWLGRSHNLARINADRDTALEILKRGLDPKVHPDPEATFDQILTALTRKDVAGSQNKGIGLRRKIEFVDAEAEYEWYVRFSDGNMAANLMRTAEALVQEVLMAERHGPLWRQRLPTLLSDVATDTARLHNISPEAAAKRAGFARNVVMTATTEFDKAANQTLQNWAAGFQSWGSAVWLGLTSITQTVVDTGISTFQGRMIHGGFARSFGNQFANLVRVLKDEGMFKDFVIANGVWKDAYTIQGSGRLPMIMDPSIRLGGTAADGPAAPQTMGERFARSGAQAAQITQRLTLSMHIERAGRSANFVSTNVAIANRHANTEWDALPRKFREFYLERSGIGKREWDTIRQTESNAVGIDLEALARNNPETYRRYISFLHKESEMAIVRPSTADRVFLTMGTSPGTSGRIAMGMITQFMSWSTAFFRGPMAREWQMGRSGFSAFAGSMIILAAIDMQLRALVTNRPTYEWESPDLWWRATLRSGLLSPLGEMAAQQMDPTYGNQLPGAVPSTIARLGMSAGRSVTDFAAGDMEKGAARLVRAGKGVTPNWWMTEWLVGGLADSIVEELDPEYARQRERRLRDQGRNVD